MIKTLPNKQVFIFDEVEETAKMEFHLLYEGKLPAQGANNTRVKEKHILRKYFHAQLRELWEIDPNLKSQRDMLCARDKNPGGGYTYQTNDTGIVGVLPVKKYIDWIADDHQRCNGRFVPLVSSKGEYTCVLDILFLRRDNPGNVITSGGDIDNRIKVLLDGLRMPKDVPELGGLIIDHDENPFYCLLEDDDLITKVTINTDRLIKPQETSENIHDVFLDIHVTINRPGLIFAGNRLI